MEAEERLSCTIFNVYMLVTLSLCAATRGEDGLLQYGRTNKSKTMAYFTKSRAWGSKVKAIHHIRSDYWESPSGCSWNDSGNLGDL